MRHLLCTPVHRRRKGGFLEQLRELALVRSKGFDAGFLLLDSSTSPGLHLEQLQKASDRYPDVPWIHVDRTSIQDLCARASAGRQEMMELLLPQPEQANYGKVANLLALATLSQGALTLARRDCDEFLVERAEEPGFWSPLLRELELLESHPEARIAGTTHFGDCDVNVDQIYDLGGPELMAELGALLGLNLNFADPAVRARLRHPRPDPWEDWARVGPGEPVYPGVASYRLLFEQVPVSPAPETPDVDNLYVVVAATCGWPMAAHGRLLRHRHSPGRKATPHDYWRRLSRAIDYTAVMGPVLVALSHSRPEPEELRRAVVDLLGARRVSLPLGRSQRRLRQKRFAAFVARLPESAGLAAELEAGAEALMDGQEEALTNHFRLAQAWPTLVERVRGCLVG